MIKEQRSESFKSELQSDESNVGITKSVSFSNAVRIHASSLHKTFNKDKGGYTIIVPFDHELNLYLIKDEDVTEHKEYIHDTLSKFNISFISDKSYIPVPIIFLMVLFYLCIIFILLYISLLISVICLYNPGILLVLAYLITQVLFITLIHMYYRIKDNYKQKKFIRMLNEESKQSKEKYKIEWSYGKDGSWLEITKSL